MKACITHNAQLVGALAMVLVSLLQIYSRYLPTTSQMTFPRQGTERTNWSSDLSVSEKPRPPMDLGDAMDEVVRLLFANNQTAAEEYIQKYPGRNFRFYVYDTLPTEWSYPYVSQCAYKKQHSLQKDNLTSTCDWGLSICSEQQTNTIYATRRFNRNADLILSKIFAEYNGTLRTYHPDEADLFVVPFPASGHCACHNDVARCPRVKQEDIETHVIGNLKYYNETTQHRHVFLSSVQGDVNHPFMKKQPVLLTIEVDANRCKLGTNCGQVTIPYANTNWDYQPSTMLQTTTTIPKDRTFAVGSAIKRTHVFQGRSAKDLQKPQIRAQFVEEAVRYFQNQTTGLLGNNPVHITGAVNNTSLVTTSMEGGERDTLQLYRDSIFCPILRGDTPAQKRFFDVMLSGCIPIVMEYKSNEKGYPSFWEPNRASVRLVYPFAKGSFHGDSNMGIDYGSLVVAINGTCGVKCIFPQLEHMLLQEPTQIVEMQQNLARIKSLFSYGMEDNALKYPDAAAAILVKLRHYLHSL